MSDQLKNLLIGIFVFVAMAITVSLILFMEPKIGDGKKIIHVRFSYISGIVVGTRVTMAGKPVGEVVKIEIVKNSREDIKDSVGRVYYYDLTLRVDSSVDIFNTDEVAIRTTGLLGEKSIAIIPKIANSGEEVKRITNEVIYADSMEPLESAFYKISTLAEKIGTTVGHIDQWFVDNKNYLSSAVKSFGDAMAEVDLALESIQKERLIPALKESAVAFTDTMKSANEILLEVKEDEIVAKLDTILDNFAETSIFVNSQGRPFLTNLNKISENIAMGRGTIGRLINNTDLYLQASSIFTKIDTLMNDINHYGVLFQYDKRWQKIRTKQANLLEALNTPQQFRSYFQNEMDSITTSLERVSVLLEKASTPDKKKEVMDSKNFQKSFYELLRQVESLENSIKLYNEGVVDTINSEDEPSPAAKDDEKSSSCKK